MRATIFKKDGDYAAFESILHEGLQIHEIDLFSYQLMPNHYHLIVRPLVDHEMGRFMAWLGGLTPHAPSLLKIEVLCRR
jgi:putative transposase